MSGSAGLFNKNKKNVTSSGAQRWAEREMGNTKKYGHPNAGIVVGYWRNGCSYRNIAREVVSHSNTAYGIIKRFRERGNFVCGRRTRRPRKPNDRDDRLLYRLAMENRRFSVQRLRRAWQPNVNYVVSRQTVNMRLVARAYRARRMVKVPRLTEGQTCATLLGPETHQSTTRPMATCHLLRRKSIHALPDRQSDPCSKTGCRSYE